MDNLPNKIVKEALTWLDTPWQSNQACKGVGVDCIRLILQIYQNVGVNTGKRYNYYRTPVGNSLVNHIDSIPATSESNNLEVGCLLIFYIAKVPHHTGIYLGDGKFIHASQVSKKVVVATLGDKWKKRIAKIYKVSINNG